MAIFFILLPASFSRLSSLTSVVFSKSGCFRKPRSVKWARHIQPGCTRGSCGTTGGGKGHASNGGAEKTKREDSLFSCKTLFQRVKVLGYTQIEPNFFLSFFFFLFRNKFWQAHVSPFMRDHNQHLTKLQHRNRKLLECHLFNQGCYSNKRKKFPDFSLIILRNFFVLHHKNIRHTGVL